MAIDFKHVDNANPVADYLTSVLSTHLEQGEAVLWLLTGGSAMGVAVAVAMQLAANQVNVSQLRIGLIDERYGPVGHVDSNWQQLIDKGFDLPGATLIPVLNGQNLAVTADSYDASLRHALDSSSYCLGFFGIGPDGHIAGILPGPGSPALQAPAGRMAVGYDDSDISVEPAAGVKRGVPRLTMTPAAVALLDEAVCLALGASKRPALELLHQASGGSVSELPARLLRDLPRVTIFTDQIA